MKLHATVEVHANASRSMSVCTVQIGAGLTRGLPEAGGRAAETKKLEQRDSGHPTEMLA